MSSHDGDAAPHLTIIKRKKVVKGDGHHGGAWKVAYADFVTAMMAFFLLMWLLNATTEEQRKGIADYFNPTIPMSRISGGGSDALNGSSIFTEETYAQMGTGASQSRTVARPGGTDNGKDKDKEGEGIAERLEDIKAELGEAEAKLLSEQLLIKQTPEGIELEIIDSDSLPLFELGSSRPTATLERIVELVGPSFLGFENEIKIVGHTDSRRYRNEASYDNWDLSADRANTARRLLVEAGFPNDRIREVSGKADTELLIEGDPEAVQNRRISITIITQ